MAACGKTVLPPPITDPRVFFVIYEHEEVSKMARKRYSDDDVLNLLRQIELSLASGSSVETACRSAGVDAGTYYNWRKKYSGMDKSQLQELKGLEKENERLKRIVTDLELDKLILKESLDYLKPKV
jgi:putative transposase